MLILHTYTNLYIIQILYTNFYLYVIFIDNLQYFNLQYFYSNIYSFKNVTIWKLKTIRINVTRRQCSSSSYYIL